LYVLDGAKALQAAVKRHAGEAALIQRGQAHKRRNVLEQLPEEHQPGIDPRLLAAYEMTEYAGAHRALQQVHRELHRINPSAARSVAEGMEDTLTVHKLRAPELLQKSLSSTKRHRIGLFGGRGIMPTRETLAETKGNAGLALLARRYF
jgi:transposase-like protein